MEGISKEGEEKMEDQDKIANVAVTMIAVTVTSTTAARSAVYRVSRLFANLKAMNKNIDKQIKPTSPAWVPSSS